MANEHIGRLQSLGIGKETVSGTPVSATAWIPCESFEMKPSTKYVRDTAGYGVIDEVRESTITENTSETSVAGVARMKTVGHLIKAALGSEAVTSPEAGAYAHAFTRKNDNSPVTYTFVEDTPVGEQRSAYNVLDTLDIEAKAGDFVRFNAKFQGGVMGTTSGNTPSYASEQPFLASALTVKLADTTGGLGAASAVPLSNIKFTIEKNPVKYMAVGSLNVSSIHNQQFTVKGDMEVIFNSATYRDIVTGATKKALRFTATAATVIDTTSTFPALEFEFARLSFEEWSKSTDNNGLVTQKLGFVGEFSITDSKTVSAILTNDQAAAY